jgi:hypothetical protein
VDDRLIARRALGALAVSPVPRDALDVYANLVLRELAVRALARVVLARRDAKDRQQTNDGS